MITHACWNVRAGSKNDNKEVPYPAIKWTICPKQVRGINLRWLDSGFVGFCQDKIQGHFKDSTSEFKDILNGDKWIFRRAKHVVVNIFASVVDKCTYCFRFIQKIDNLWCSPPGMCAFELWAFYLDEMTQYHKVNSPLGNPKTHHNMHITAETCFVTGI